MACLNIYSPHLYAPLRGIFGPNSAGAAHHAFLIGAKSLTKCGTQLSESNCQRIEIIVAKSVPGNPEVLYSLGNSKNVKP